MSILCVCARRRAQTHHNQMIVRVRETPRTQKKKKEEITERCIGAAHTAFCIWLIIVCVYINIWNVVCAFVGRTILINPIAVEDHYR